ncbi:CocE/NonD family hydrolase [Nannocystaceae bacterium ST9]
MGRDRRAGALALALLGCPRAEPAPEVEPASEVEPSSIASEPPAGAEAMKARYTKTETRIRMRDGVELFTIIYAPRDGSKPWPILLTRTAYGIAPYGPDEYREVIGPSPAFAEAGYIVVYQDTRGKFESQGEFVHHRPYVAGEVNESSDTWDTIDWLVRNVPNNNGKVGQWGISWAGWEVSMGMIDAHPALAASSPQAPPQDQFLGDDHHSGGAFQLMYAFAWMASHARARAAPNRQDAGKFDYGTPDGYAFFLELGAAANAGELFADEVPTWTDYMQHGTYDDYWKSRNVPKDLHGIRHPVLLVASWFDAQDFWGPFRMYEALVANNPDNPTYFVVGPWLHGGHARTEGDRLGAIEFGSPTAAYYREQIELPFFEYHLKGEGRFEQPRVQVFETGRNAWRSLDQWPPTDTRPLALYLREGSTLAREPASGEGADVYASDPAKPVPYTAEIRTSEGHEFMVEDQRFAWTRPDVLHYQSEPLAEPLTIAGPIVASLHVATTGTDVDFVVKLIDVFPGDAPDPDPNASGVRMGGFQMLLAADILRCKFRQSFSEPVPMVPGELTRIEIPLGDKYHTFEKGHRVMVQVQSSWFPMFDRNPQTFVDVYRAKPEDYRPATNTVFRSAEAPSFVTLRVLE